MMTEAEWLACEDPTEMLLFIKQRRGMRKHTKQRKQRLFSVACCRRIWHLIVNDQCWRCIEAVERFADDQATSEELQAAEADATAIWLKNAANNALLACNQLFWKNNDGLHISASTISAVFEEEQAKANKPVDPLGGRKRGASPSEEREQCRLLRCIFGNPFQPPAMSTVWLTPTVSAMAREMYVDREFSAMPILADALQDAGCDDANILDHCRGPGPHVRGCCVVDLLLGK
jgi:hypothetical protein